ncbi:hypothetical protein [Fontivita pretiosa]|uniref:hypothetical protein n=1 Tax=Fontivita pretiosa TaxID=2989684 RepID=UPI003D166F4A
MSVAWPTNLGGSAPLSEELWPRGLRRTIDLTALHPDATFLRILGVNYVHIPTADGGDLYLTERGVPFVRHLDPRNWYEPQWFKQHRQRLAGTGTVYRLPTRPLDGQTMDDRSGTGDRRDMTPGAATAAAGRRPGPDSIDLVVKWSRVGQDVALDTFALQRNIDAEFNTPFEEFARLEELRRGEHGPASLRILTQKPLAIYVPPEQMQMWQTGRSREKILARMARHPGVEIDVLRSYIMLYQWIDGYNAIEAFAMCAPTLEARQRELKELTLRVDRELAAKGFVVADHKPTHLILRIRDGKILRRRDGSIAYALVDYELLSRTADYEDSVQAARRREYLIRQKQRFYPRPSAQFGSGLKPAKVLGVSYVFGRAQSTGGTLWVVGNDPELFGYFLPERWRTMQQVKLSERGQTYYAQTKDRIHLVWKVSRVGELPVGRLEDPQYRRILQLGYNSPFEEFALALKMASRGCKTIYPRAIYMTASPGHVSGAIQDRRRFERMRHVLSPAGMPVMPMGHDYVTIWGYWRGLEDDEAPDDVRLWTPIDVTRARTKGIIDASTAARVMARHAEQLAAAGFEDASFSSDHVLISYVPNGSIKTDASGQIESRQCNFELVHEKRLPTP